MHQKLNTAMSAPELPVPVLEFAANDGHSRPLPPLVPAPRHQGFDQFSSNAIPPPSLRMYPPNSPDFGPLFAPIIGTYAPPLNVVRPTGLQVVPPLTPAYMTMQRAASVPLVHMNVASTAASLFPAVRPAVPMTNFVHPPPLRIHWPLQSSGPVMSSFQTLRPVLGTVNPVEVPPLRLRSEDTSRHSAVPFEQMSTSATSLFPAVRPVLSNSVRPQPLQIRFAPHSTAANNFSCFNITSTKSAPVARSLPSSIVSIAVVSSVTRSQSLTSSSCLRVSSGISTSCPTGRTSSAISVSAHVINVDEDSCSESEDGDNCDDIAVVSPAESCPVRPCVEIVPSSSTAESRSNTVRGRSAQCMFPQNSNHFQPLNAGADCLQHIFQYLDISSRLKAAQVSRCWRRMVLQQHLVNSVLLVYINISLRLSFLLLSLL